MSSLHRLNGSWRLSDGLFCDLKPERVGPAYALLRDAGIVPDAARERGLLGCAWIYDRTFTYTLKFNAPLMADTERTELRFGRLFGDCTVALNGTAVAPFETCAYEITGLLVPGENTLTVTVAPSAPVSDPDHTPLPERGILGPVTLTGVNRVTVTAPSAVFDDELRVSFTADAHIAGKFRFRLTASADGEPLLEASTDRRLSACRQTVHLVFDVPENAPSQFDIRLVIENNGLFCNELLLPVCRKRSAQRGICHIAADPCADTDVALQRTIRAVHDAGFDAVSLSSDALLTPKIRVYLAEQDIALVPYAPDAPRFTGCMTESAMRILAGKDAVLPAGTPQWRLRGSRIPEGTDAEEIRAAQAAAVAGCIAASRASGTLPELGCECDTFARFGSDALLDPDGTPRPALRAAAAMLRPMLALTAAPDLTRVGTQTLPVTLLSNTPGTLAASVTADAYAADGSLLGSTSFTAVPGGTSAAGTLSLTLPEGCPFCAIRTTACIPGETPVITDAVYGTRPDGAAVETGIATVSGIRFRLPGETLSEG